MAQLFPAEQQRITRLLIERVQLHGHGLDIVWRGGRLDRIRCVDISTHPLIEESQRACRGGFGMNATTHQRQRAVHIEIGVEARSYVSGGSGHLGAPDDQAPPEPEAADTASPEIADRIGGFDAPMIKTLGKAFYWKRLIDEVRHDNGLGARLQSGTGLGCRGLADDHVGPDIVGGDIRRTPVHAI